MLECHVKKRRITVFKVKVTMKLPNVDECVGNTLGTAKPSIAKLVIVMHHLFVMNSIEKTGLLSSRSRSQRRSDCEFLLSFELLILLQPILV